jgi:superfamily I DNA/RNA helicase
LGFELDVNYRSSQPVVTAANQLAALLEHVVTRRLAATLATLL